MSERKRSLPLTAIYIFLLLVVVWAGYQAIRMAMGDIAAHRASYALEQWGKERRMPNAEEVEGAELAMRTALEWQPRNASHLDLLGSILLYKGLVRWSQGEFNVISEEALKLHYKALEQRPRWPYSWSNIALVKSYQGNVDDEFEHAIRQAVKFGPWEPDVQVSVAQAGFYSWRNLSTDTRKVVAQNVHRGLRFRRGAMVAAAKRNNVLPYVCAYMPRDKAVRRFCGW